MLICRFIIIFVIFLKIFEATIVELNSKQVEGHRNRGTVGEQGNRGTVVQLNSKQRTRDIVEEQRLYNNIQRHTILAHVSTFGAHPYCCYFMHRRLQLRLLVSGGSGGRSSGGRSSRGHSSGGRVIRKPRVGHGTRYFSHSRRPNGLTAGQINHSRTENVSLFGAGILNSFHPFFGIFDAI
eukprot:GHVR01107102.1.p1 GENE.GHVR01107102.1~~GHVR01107102.1.p1  ORF type:complete len:181 (-),score=28.13 GHVR01107102.1:8-550(-)